MDPFRILDKTSPRATLTKLTPSQKIKNIKETCICREAIRSKTLNKWVNLMLLNSKSNILN